MDNFERPRSALEAVQKLFCLIKLASCIRVIDLRQLAAYLRREPGVQLAFYERAEATILIKRELELLSLSSKPGPVIEDFYASPSTRVYEGTAFSPKPGNLRALNLWTPPLAGDPAGNADLIHQFVDEVIADGDMKKSEWLKNFLAHLLQHPEEKPGVMVVLLGAQGTGKGMFFRLLNKITRGSCLSVSNAEVVTGRFNSALEGHSGIWFDEALFAGNRKQADCLKALVTEPFITIEEKFQPIRKIESVHRFFAASNHEHFASIDADDRRMVYFRLSDKYKQSTAYFAKLVAAIEDESTVQRFVYDLRRRDLSSFDVRRKPEVLEQTSQKLKSLVGFDRYWYEVLCSGHFDLASLEIDPYEQWEKTPFKPNAMVVRQYRAFNRSAQRFQTVQVAEVVDRLLLLCPSASKTRKQVKTGLSGGTKYARGVQLPTIDVARAEFERWIGGAVRWP
jgi:hypothetical protein